MDINELLQQARRFQENMKDVQEKLGDQMVTGTAGGGMVTVTANGKGEIVGMEIDPALVRPDDRTMLQDLIVAAVNDGLSKARALGREELGRLTGGLNLPGMF